MPSDYEQIRKEHLEEYGRNSTGWRKDLLVDLYPDRTHFVFELLQNAEDALRRRNDVMSSGRVTFSVRHDAVRFSHRGDLFTTEDVRGVCAIARRAKEHDLTAIGRFGIGFKSVYAITDRPEVHSGEEHFAVQDYVQPVAVPPIALAEGETVIRLPLRDGGDRNNIARQFDRLGEARTLLFLREIDEIEWSHEGDREGSYRREEHEKSEGVRWVKLSSIVDGGESGEETWLVFSREVHDEGRPAGYVELAFRITTDDDGASAIDVIRDSPLTAFFPTVLETHLGMRIQGPYRTTSSRENIPPDAEWNRYLVGETATLLVDSLWSLRDEGLLTARVFEALPLDPKRFTADNRFAPLFAAVDEAIASEPLLPAHRGGYVAASQARLADGAGLRNLVSRAQLTDLVGEEDQVLWLDGKIDTEQTPKLYKYLTEEQGVEEVSYDDLLWWLRFNDPFMTDQNDRWIRRLYSFLGREEPSPWQLNDVPLIRLEDGSHVTLGTDTRPNAFLPTDPPSGYPNTVRATVCDSKPAWAFLESLGLREPDVVDQVLKDVLALYEDEHPDIPDAEYQEHLQRFLRAFESESRERRERLTAALRDTAFVRVVDARTGERSLVRPRDAYLATQSMQALFDGVPSVLLVDEPLRHEDVTRLLAACGASRTFAIAERTVSRGYLPSNDEFWRPFGITAERRLEMRGRGRVTRDSTQVVINREYRGLSALLEHFATLHPEDAKRRARLLWDALRAAPDDGLEGTYEWFYYGKHARSFPSTSVRLLTDKAWVPVESGALEPPHSVEFKTLRWAPDATLQSHVTFRRPTLPSRRARVAKEMGVGVDLLDKVTKLKERGFSDDEIGEELDLLAQRPTRPDSNLDGGTEVGVGAGGMGDAAGSRGSGGLTYTRRGDANAGAGAQLGRSGVGAGEGGRTGDPSMGGRAARGRSPTPGVGRFVSYISVRSEPDEEPDPDGLGHQERMSLEEAAIALIRDREPALQPTPPNNPGFDLLERDDGGAPMRWVEVKAMSGDWGTRPVTLTHTQFEHAREKGAAYWLYVVERASSDDPSVLKIQDPAGRASTYTFDEGWRDAP